MINSSQRPLPDHTQHSQQTYIHAPGGIRTHNLSRRAAVDPCLRPRGHCDRQLTFQLSLFSCIPSSLIYPSCIFWFCLSLSTPFLFSNLPFFLVFVLYRSDQCLPCETSGQWKNGLRSKLNLCSDPLHCSRYDRKLRSDSRAYGFIELFYVSANHS